VLESALRPLTEAPEQAAILCDIDGTIAPISSRFEEARVPPAATRALADLSRRYAVVACVSGRSALDAKRLAGVGALAYAGSHGAELLWPGDTEPRVVPEFERYADKVHAFAASHDGDELRTLGIRIEDKGPIVAFHWRGARDEEAALTRIQAIAAEAESAGFLTHWGRKVLEIRPPVPIDKGQAVRELLRRRPVRTAVFGGDDATDLDVFDVLGELRSEGALDTAVCIGVRSDEGPAAIVERADLVVDGTQGFVQVLEVLAG
jgi:trehalose 6-phosphate phosphatase